MMIFPGILPIQADRGAKMKKIILIILLVLIMITVGGVTYMKLFGETEEAQTEKIQPFSLSDYSETINDFASDKVLGAVNTSDSAKEKAETVWIEIYGDSVKEDKPYKVYFDEQNQVWLVKGTLPEMYFGGVPYILIQKSDGKVLAVWHTK